MNAFSLSEFESSAISSLGYLFDSHEAPMTIAMFFFSLGEKEYPVVGNMFSFSKSIASVISKFNASATTKEFLLTIFAS